MAVQTFFDFDSITMKHVEEQLDNIGDDLSNDYAKVYAAAADFITNYIKILELANSTETAKSKKKGITNLLARVQGLQGTELINYLNERDTGLRTFDTKEKAKEIEQELFREQSKFYSIVNSILGQSIDYAVVYVDAQNKTVDIYRTSDEKIVDAMVPSAESGKSGGLQAKVSKNVFESLTPEFTQEKKINVKGLQVAYLESLRRFLYSGKIRRVMWYLHNKWNKMKVSAAGDLSESYAAYFLSDNPPPTFNYSIMGEGIQQFMWGDGSFEDDAAFDPRSVAAIDNAPGALEGDFEMTQIKAITRNLRGRVTLPSIAGFNNTLEIAQEILTHDVSEVKQVVENLKKKFRKDSVYRNSRVNDCVEGEAKLMTKKIMDMDKSKIDFDVYLNG